MTVPSNKEPRDLEIEQLASLLPEGNFLPEQAWLSVIRLNQAVLNGDAEALKKAEKTYEACIWKLNGNTFFGSSADEYQAAEVIDAYCKADNGQVPIWGQKGSFLVVSREGVRAWVEVERACRYCSASFHVVDLDKPFISSTGYRSHIFYYKEVSPGESVSDYFTRILNDHLDDKKKPEFLDPEYRDSCAKDSLPEWLTRIVPAPCRLPESLPAGFVRVEAVLPAAKAFTARKWSEIAKKRIQLLIQEENELSSEKEAQSRRAAAPHKIYKGGVKTVERYREFYVGAECEIVSVHHPVLERLIGNRIKIVTIYDSGTIAAHDVKPVVTRVNRRGNTVTVSDPSTIRSFYGAEQLRLITPEADNSDNG